MPENRFKKSVDIATLNTVGNIQDNILDNNNIKSNILDNDNINNNILDNIRDNTSDNIRDNTSDNIKDITSDNIIYNILDNITSKEKKSRGGNHTFYLSQEVGEALNKLSKKTKQSKSTLVNEILKAVFTENQLL